MKPATRAMQDLTVADAMNTELVTLSACSTMEEAAKAFALHGVTGAPVLDESGRVVGVLSTTDFARRDETKSCTDSSAVYQNEFELRKDRSEPYHIEHEPTGYVRQHMTSAVQSIDGQQSLLDAAHCMLAEQLHHLIVVDDHGRPTGMLDSRDILAAMTGVIESATEQKSQNVG